MKMRKSLIIPGLLVASALPIGWALAQAGPPAPGMGPGMGPDMMGPGMMGPGMMGHHGGHHFGRGMRSMTPEMRASLLDGRIAGAKAALKLNENQLKLFAPLEEQIRSNAAFREKRMQDYRAAYEAQAQADPSKQDQAKQAPSLADRIDRRATMMSENADRMKAFAAAFKPFYDSLNDDQKALAGMLLPGAGRGMGRKHHHHWAMDDGAGYGRGMGPGMMGPGMMGPGMQGPGMGPGMMGPGMGPGTPPAPRQQ